MNRGHYSGDGHRHYRPGWGYRYGIAPLVGVYPPYCGYPPYPPCIGGGAVVPAQSKLGGKQKPKRRGHPIPYRPRGLKARKGKAAPGSTRGHSAKFERCVKAVKARGSAVNPYAICVASTGW